MNNEAGPKVLLLLLLLVAAHGEQRVIKFNRLKRVRVGCVYIQGVAASSDLSLGSLKIHAKAAFTQQRRWAINRAFTVVTLSIYTQMGGGLISGQDPATRHTRFIGYNSRFTSHLILLLLLYKRILAYI